MSKINENLSLESDDEFSSRIHRNIKSILENHFVGAEIPAGAVIRMQEVFSHKSQLQIT